MYPQGRQPFRHEEDEDDDDLVTDSAIGMRYGLTDTVDSVDMAQRRSAASRHEPALISRDGSVRPTLQMKNTSDRFQSVSGRADSGFDSLYSDRFQSERLKSTDSLGMNPSPMTAGSIAKASHDVYSSHDYRIDSGYGDSGYGMSSELCSSGHDEEITDRLEKLTLQKSEAASLNSPSCSDSTPSLSIWEDAFAQDDDGDTTLHLAIIHELKKEVSSLIENVPYKFYLDSKNNLQQTPLHLAVLTNQPELVRKLMIAGAGWDIRDRKGNTALHLACQEGYSECAKSLLTWQYGSRQDLELCNYDGQRCVHLATLSNQPEILRLLYENEADMNAQEGKSGRTALHYAVEAGNNGLVQLLAAQCQADVNAQTYSGLTPVQMVYQRDRSMVSYLIWLGAADIGPPPSDSESESDSSADESTKMDTMNDYDFCIKGQPLV